ncbi:MAG TPA: hypothetical protein VFE53_11565, partial [Mucilaginibacter sp.]|nr:hypothetical protein [Mucilaginibacter sp.]
VISCKKPATKEYTVPYHIYFVILDKNEKNIIQSVKDSLNVSYILNGVAKSQRLIIYHVQVSATDTATISKYGGFVVSDIDKAGILQGYITDASAYSGVRNFNLYLKGVSIGTMYLDYYGDLADIAATSSTFTFDGTPVTTDHLIGVFNDGSGIAADVEYNTTPPGQPIAVLQMQ